MITIIIAGSRSITNFDDVSRIIAQCPWPINRIVSGGATGVDALAIEYAISKYYANEIFEANWDANGKVAGLIRNHQMAENADALIAIWDGKSAGTKHMIETAVKHKLQMYIRILK